MLTDAEFLTAAFFTVTIGWIIGALVALIPVVFVVAVRHACKRSGL